MDESPDGVHFGIKSIISATQVSICVKVDAFYNLLVLFLDVSELFLLQYCARRRKSGRGEGRYFARQTHAVTNGHLEIP